MSIDEDKFQTKILCAIIYDEFSRTIVCSMCDMESREPFRSSIQKQCETRISVFEYFVCAVGLMRLIWP